MEHDIRGVKKKRKGPATSGQARRVDTEQVKGERKADRGDTCSTARTTGGKERRQAKDPQAWTQSCCQA